MGCWFKFIKNLKTVLYVADIGSDAYNTYGFYQDCHYQLFYTSLVLLLLPNLVGGISEVAFLLRF